MENINGCLLGLYEKALPDDLSWEARLAEAKTAGYDFIEISVDETDDRMSRVSWTRAKREALRRLCYRLDMPVLSMCLSGNRRYPIGSEDEQIRQKGIRLIKNAVDFSVSMGIRIIQLAGYDEYYNEANENTREHFIHGLKDVVAYGAARGVPMALETVDTDLIDSVEKAMYFVSVIDSPYLQVYPDIGNITARGNSVERDFLSGKGHLAAIHLKDTLPGKVRDIPYGEGSVDFVGFFKLMKRMGFRGLLVAEMWAKGGRQHSIDDIRAARTFLLDRYAEAADL